MYATMLNDLFVSRKIEGPMVGVIVQIVSLHYVSATAVHNG